ncbi:DUF4150 domain-containing protein [Rhizobium tumorigenes]|uniref:DUF4150 domain-containing protein n=1 Tax=Rhizobium tumorigenes TaxID=2041385 RepID=A0AAF1KS63_9HYPH|nr:DUF4150 domain-containing protein [Rhizobium tumorigenes]WFR97542.1 DUF4150 domain-containing protein [Rhizobium tumorigenes]WFS03143.1 DUF4150 domain-containing protein [Rhizobium tumorigenes]
MADDEDSPATPDPEPIEWVRIDTNADRWKQFPGQVEQKADTPPPTAANPPPPEFIPSDSMALAICLSPDVCKSPENPVPYMSWGKASDSLNYSPDVRSNGLFIKRQDSKFSCCYGDEPGVGLGCKSQTVGDVVEPVTSSGIVRANGIWVQRHNDRCTLNNGNTEGEYVHVKSTDVHAAPSSTDHQDKAWYEKAWEWSGDKLSQANKAVWDFDNSHYKVVTRGIAAVGVVGSAFEGAAGLALATGGGAASATGVGAAPGIPAMAGGALLVGNAVDNGQANLKTLWTGEFQQTNLQKIAGSAARAAGASPETAEGVENVTGMTQAIGGGFGAAAATMKTAAEGAHVASTIGRTEARTEGSQAAEDAAKTAKSEVDGSQGARSTKEELEPPKKKLTKEEYKKLRSKTPNQRIRDAVNESQPKATPENPVDDPWLPGKQRTQSLEADHIVSMKEITQMDGFADLSPENQLKVLNNPDNFTGLSKSANASKGAKSFEDWTTYGQGGDQITVNTKLRQQMIDRSTTLRPQLQQQINELNSTQR